MYEIFSVESRKGGVGKTTIALNLAKALVKKKYDVLLIDCDITGTPISKAAMNSSFWSKDVVVSMKDGKPYNLIDSFNGVFLRGQDREQEIIDGMNLTPKKVHLIGSEIYDENSNLIIDPRDLMDDLHSYWFLDYIKRIAKLFCDAMKQEKKAIILDNSPGYVGIGRSVREWLTKEGPGKATFVLVSSLDEQDMESTIDSAEEIQRMMQSDFNVGSYVKVVINKVPEGLLSENSGYDFKVEKGTKRAELVSELFPLNRDKYPKNLIKYDSAISGQFIEARLKPKIKEDNQFFILMDYLQKLYQKADNFGQKQDPYSNIATLDTVYKKVLKAFSDCGYVRLSKALGGELMPSNMLKGLKVMVGKLGGMAHPNFRVTDFNKELLWHRSIQDLDAFIVEMHLAQYSPILYSLIDGLFRQAGYYRKDVNVFKIFNLFILLEGFYQRQRAYRFSDNYRGLLISEIGKKRWSKTFVDQKLINFIRTDLLTSQAHPQDTYDVYIYNLWKAYFGGFYHAMCYSLLRMIDCSRDYCLLVDVCKSALGQDAKMMCEDLTEHLKAIISKKKEEPDSKLLFQLVEEPFEMKAIQSLMKNFVLAK